MKVLQFDSVAIFIVYNVLPFYLTEKKAVFYTRQNIDFKAPLRVLFSFGLYCVIDIVLVNWEGYIQGQTIQGQTIQGQTIQGQTIRGQTIRGQTIRRQTGECW